MGRGRTVVAFVSTIVLLTARAGAQSTLPASTDSSCSYRRCALGIAPTWNGLAVVRGTDGARVANLGFFLPRSLGRVFTGQDSAVAYGGRAVRVRRTAAVLTDAGVILLGCAVARRATTGKLPGGTAVMGATGAAAFLVSVPLQFRADGLLSRAVWWHNLRYARQRSPVDGPSPPDREGPAFARRISRGR